MKGLILKLKYGIAILTFIAFPFILNLLIGLENPTGVNVIGESSDWLNFWAAYFGASIPILVLWITLKDNRVSRNQQHQEILYQLYVNSIIQYKVVIQDILDIINNTNIEELVKIIKQSGLYEKRELFVKDLLTRLNTSTNSFRLEFASNLDKTEKDYLKFFEDVRIIFSDILRDIIWISSQGLVDSFGRSRIDDFQKNLFIYKEKSENSGLNNSNRIWSLIDDSDLDEESFPYSIIDKLASNDISSLFYEASMNFIKYENSKARNILNGTK